MTSPAADIALRFTEAWNERDLDTVLRLTAADCVFDSANRTSVGILTGRDALRECWGEILERSTGTLAIDAVHVDGPHVTLRWTMRSPDREVAGVDLLVVRDGLIRSKSGYIKV